MCFFTYEHDIAHCVIDINNKEFLEENNITYKDSISEFDKVFDKAKDIKKKIEEEIEKINNLHSKIMDEITKSFEVQRIKLNEKENEIKYELDIKVTKVKEELEKFLIESNDILISCERTEKATKYFKKKNNGNDIRYLYYISEINKNNEKAKELLDKPIKNMKVSLKIDNTLEFKEYYINEIDPKEENIIKIKEDNNIFNPLFVDINNINNKGLFSNELNENEN